MPHEPLITKLTLFYQTLAALTYISPSDILLPPNQISLTAAHEAGLLSEAIDLLQHLPHLSDDISTLPILPDGTQAVFYTSEDECLEWSRTPTYQDSPEIASSAFVLTNPNIYGTSLIYDTVTSKLLPWEAWGKHVNFEIAGMENPFEELDDDDAKPANEILKSWITNFITLTWVPFENEIVIEPDEDEVREAMRDADIMVQYRAQFIHWSFRDVYISAGWNIHAPDLEGAKTDFDVEDFAMKKAVWIEQTQEMLNRAYEQQWPWQKIRMELGGELANNQRARLLDAVIGTEWQQRRIEL